MWGEPGIKVKTFYRFMNIWMVCKFCFNSHSNSINVLLHALDAHKRNVGGIQHEKKVLLLLKRGVDDDVLNVSISGFYFKSPSRSQESRVPIVFVVFLCGRTLYSVL